MLISSFHDNETLDIQVNSVSIVGISNHIVKLFRCPYCSSAIIQHEGVVEKIYPFLEPTISLIFINKCDRCGAFFTFQSFIGRKVPLLTKIMLLYTNLHLSDVFRCITCRMPLLEYNKETIL